MHVRVSRDAFNERALFSIEAVGVLIPVQIWAAVPQAMDLWLVMALRLDLGFLRGDSPTFSELPKKCLQSQQRTRFDPSSSTAVNVQLVALHQMI